MSRWIERGTAAAALLGGCLLLAAAGCGTARPAPGGQRTALRSQDPDKIVLARGQPRLQLLLGRRARPREFHLLLLRAGARVSRHGPADRPGHRVAFRDF